MTHRVGVIGAGLSGLMAARTLQLAGLDVVVFDKGRRVGGRANTREHSDYRFDHGAQFFTVRDEALDPHLQGWLREGLVQEWGGRLVRIEGEAMSPAKEATRYVGVPGMINLALHLASTLDVQTLVRIEKVDASRSGWKFLDTEAALRGEFQSVVVAVPPAQAVPLLSGAPALQEQVGRIHVAPCWAVMLAFDEPLQLGFDGAFITEGPLSWIARDSSKPGRPKSESWVLHATPEWTRRHWEVDGSEVPRLMLDTLRNRFGTLPSPIFERAHRWGYALAGEPLRVGCSYDDAVGIGVCGDWCMGGRVEDALLSGMNVAKRMLERLDDRAQPHARLRINQKLPSLRP
jgi:renalase